jgi:hypothetical protein
MAPANLYELPALDRSSVSDRLHAGRDRVPAHKTTGDDK